MSKQSKPGGYGRWLTLIGGVAGGAVLAASAIPALKRRAMRATTILKKDHRMVSGLFWALEQTPSASVRKSIFSQIRHHVDVHATVEEEIFYPAVRNLYTANAQSQVDEANGEHQRIKELLHRISELEATSNEFMSKVRELKGNIDHHVDEEEHEMFPLVHRNMSNAELEHLGYRMHERKGQLKERLAA